VEEVQDTFWFQKPMLKACCEDNVAITYQVQRETDCEDETDSGFYLYCVGGVGPRILGRECDSATENADVGSWISRKHLCVVGARRLSAARRIDRLALSSIPRSAALCNEGSTSSLLESLARLLRHRKCERFGRRTGMTP
jgi:hypothetical protein